MVSFRRAAGGVNVVWLSALARETTSLWHQPMRGIPTSGETPKQAARPANPGMRPPRRRRRGRVTIDI